MHASSALDKLRGVGDFIPVVHANTGNLPDDEPEAAEAVAATLKELGFTTTLLNVDEDLSAVEKVPTPLLVFNLIDTINCDGRLAPMVPARLDSLGIPYTGCSSTALFETLSKTSVKLKLVHAGLPTPEWSEDGDGLPNLARVIVKPIWEHGSLGIDPKSVVRGVEAAKLIVERTLRLETEHFAEIYIDGREFAVAMLDRPDGVQVLPIRETLFEAFAEGDPLITDYDSKWRPDSPAYRGTPSRYGMERQEPELAAELTRLALACWKLFALGGYARVDFRVDRTGAPFILEINSNPHLSPDAGFAASAAHAGLSYKDLIGQIVEAAWLRANRGVGHAAPTRA